MSKVRKIRMSPKTDAQLNSYIYERPESDGTHWQTTEISENPVYGEYAGNAKKLEINPQVTVIMPNYNKRDYVTHAISSVLGQSLFELELIIVDDCSTDGSYEICQDYADLDGRIRLFRMDENSLQGICRNIAIDHARGDYLVCVDSDDWLHQNFLQMAVHDMEQENADLIAYATQEVNHKGEVIACKQRVPETFDGMGACRAFWTDRIPWGPWGKIFSRKFIQENNIRFETRIYHQDMFFLYRCALKAQKIVLKSEIVYTARLTRNSSIRPRQFTHTHVKSAVAKLGLRESAWQNKELELDWKQTCEAQLGSFERRLIPALGFRYGMTGKLDLEKKELDSLLDSETAMYCLLAHPAQSTQASSVIENMTIEEDHHAFLQAAKDFAVAPKLQLARGAAPSEAGTGNRDQEGEFLLASGLFDREYYLRANPDVRSTGIEPALHYAHHWQDEKFRNPAPWFNTLQYLASNPDVEAAGINPFIHYIISGFSEGRQIFKPASNKIHHIDSNDFNTFFKYKFAGKKILIVEPNNCHGEILPGFVKYLIDLEYDIDIIISPQQAAKDPFARMKDQHLNIFILTRHELSFYLQNSPNMANYEFVLFSSFNLYTKLGNNEYPNIFEYFPGIIRPRKGIYAVAHHSELTAGINQEDIGFISLHNIGRDDFYVVNPHYFGHINITRKSTKRTHFAVIGALNEPERRNINLLIDAASKLKASRREDFFVTLLGRGEVDLPGDIARYFHKMGPAPFPDMYKKLEDADFLLSLFDPADSRHDRYITTATSGIFQLSLGSATPLIIPEKFASPRGLANKNAIVYSPPDDLADAMLRAMDMTQPQYELMQAAIQRQADILKENSLANLRDLLGINKNI